MSKRRAAAKRGAVTKQVQKEIAARLIPTTFGNQPKPPKCDRCGQVIRDNEYMREPDGTARHVNACPPDELAACGPHVSYTLAQLRQGTGFAKGARFVHVEQRDELAEQLARLMDAADGVVSRWEEGDLASAVNNLQHEAEDARELLKRVLGFGPAIDEVQS